MFTYAARLPLVALVVLVALLGFAGAAAQAQPNTLTISMDVEAGPHDHFTFSGTVTGEGAAGSTIYFTGLDAMNGQTVLVEQDGTFTITVYIPPNENGYVFAQTTGSNTAVVEVMHIY